MKKRILSILMALVMIIGLVPMTAFAKEDKDTPSVEEEDDAKEDEGEDKDVKPCYWVNKVTLDGEKITPQKGYWTELGLDEGEVLTVRFCYGTTVENETVVPSDAPVFQPEEDTDGNAVTITADEYVSGVYKITAVSVGSGTIEVLLEDERIEFSVVVEESEGEDDGNNKENDEDDKDKEDDEEDEDDKDEIIHSPEIPGENTAFFEYNGTNYVIGFTDQGATYYVDGTMGNYTQDHLDNDAYRKREQRSYIGISEVGESQGLEDLKEAEEMYQLIEEIEIYTAIYDKDTKELVPIDEDDLLYSPSYDFRTLNTDETGQYYVPYYRLFNDGYHYLVGEVTWKENVELEPLQFSFYFRSTFVTSKEIDLSDKEYKDLNDLDELNDFIAEDVQEDTKAYRYDIILDPEVTYEGTLELQGEKKIVINGNGATLKGNVVVTRPEEENDTEIMRYHEIQNLHMVSTDDGMVGISGDGNLYANTVNFTGYDRAVEVYDVEDTELQKAAFTNCWFIDNEVGIYWDGKDILKRSGNSNYLITRCRFEENDTAIQVVKHKEIHDTGHLIQIENCEFVENDIDVANTSKYTYWAEGCFFAARDKNSGEEVSRPARTEKILVSYIYKEPILEYQELPEDKGITNKNWFIKGFKGGTPVAPDGDFAYNNESGKPSIEMADFDKNITVLGKYDLEKDKHKLIGTWHFGEGDVE